MTNVLAAQKRLIEWTNHNSGAEDRRYLGMSDISRCPLSLYRKMLDGRAWSEQDHAMCRAGYVWETEIKRRLVATGLCRVGPGPEHVDALGFYHSGSERELIAKFDRRFRGHTDGETTEGELLEIKSTTQDKLDRIVSEARLPTAHFDQVQVYMHHGGYTRRAVMVYAARDTGTLYMTVVTFLPRVADRLDDKALRVLTAVDAASPPACECGRCP